MELDVGKFKVKSKDGPFQIDFMLVKDNMNRRKNFLCIDGLCIRSSFTAAICLMGAQISAAHLMGPKKSKFAQSGLL
jgi:hypothetical protein